VKGDGVKKLLIVDDSQETRQQLKWGLDQDFQLLLAADARQALETFRAERSAVVVLDLGMPATPDTSPEGLRCLEEMLALNPAAKVIMLTGEHERENALKAMRMGAFDCYGKPPVLAELKVIIGRAFHIAKLEELESRERILTPSCQGNEQWGMVGACREMQSVFTTIRKVARSNAPVLITGESGTGKELVAGAIHQASLRGKGAFVPINCGAIPENLLESELFGHEKGAFTGAHIAVQGKLQYAHKGTLFLDEIGDLPVNLQVKLLRFLQEGTIQRVGGRGDIAVDARTTCATNVDIAKGICEGRFREDLFYRISVINIKLPPLRERGDDILLLAETFLKQYAKENRKKALKFSAPANAFLKRHRWPGNVRELRNRVQRAAIMCEGPLVSPVDLGCDCDPAVELAPARGPLSLREARERMEREMILGAMERQSGNILKAAEELGVSRPTLYDLMKKLSINQAQAG
jgi:two-component system, NtrC family, response regulator